MQSGQVVSVIVPVFNGSDYLTNCIDNVRSCFESQGAPYELIIAEDGSTDGTKALLKELTERDPSLKLIQDEHRLGRGASLCRAIQQTKGDVIVYTDVDMATDIGHLGQLITCVQDGADVATGSRYLPDSQATRSLPRLVSSLVYNDLARRLLASKLTDHQCGFKAFKRSVVLDLLPQVHSSHWFWDTEILVRAQRSGYRVKEIPVHWQESKYGKSTVKLASDSMHFMRDLLRLRDELETT